MADESLFIRLYLDEDFHPDVAHLIRENGFDCQSAVEAGMLTKLDSDQLEFATAAGRCLVSFNVKDFVILAQQWAADGRTHEGILVAAQVSRKQLGALTKRLLDLLNTSTADEMRNALRFF